MSDGEFRDPTTAHWWKDKTPKTCGQILSPYEQGYAPKPCALMAPDEVLPPHPDDLPYWKMPKCAEPVAHGYNPLRLCALHLALNHEAWRKRGEPVMKPGSKGAGILWDFTAPPRNLFTKNEREIAFVNKQREEEEKKRSVAEAEAHFARLQEEAAVALEAARVAREQLASAEGPAAPIEAPEAGQVALPLEGDAVPAPAPKAKKKATKAKLSTKVPKLKPPKAPKKRKPSPEQRTMFYDPHERR